MEKFEAGLKYRSLNCYHSAHSSALIPVHGFQAGQHPLVSCLMKGIFNSRPPEPRYSQTWNISLALDYITTLGPNKDLSLKLLLRKLATLLALILTHCSSDLGQLSLHGRKYSAEGVVLRLTGSAKQARPGKEKSLQPVFIAHYIEDRLLTFGACARGLQYSLCVCVCPAFPGAIKQLYSMMNTKNKLFAKFTTFSTHGFLYKYFFHELRLFSLVL